MRLTLLGTGDSHLVPVYGCACPACHAAQLDMAFRRRPCCAQIESGGHRWLIDSGLNNLCERFPPHSFDGILQTHYHADHAQGLLSLRWGANMRIPVYGPPDPEGLADLYKHPGILDFAQPFHAFECRILGMLSVTALPLTHSRPSFGYLLRDTASSCTIAYLTDTAGLPEPTLDFLKRNRPAVMVLDCTFPPQQTTPDNHNDLDTALACIESIAPERAILTHIGHELDTWRLVSRSTLPAHVQWAQDGMTIS